MWGLVIEGYLATDRRLMDEIHDRHGLTPAQFDILLRLVRTDEHRMPMTRLAHEAAFTSGGFTKVADRMVAAGLVERERCDDDRRVIYIRLTTRGRKLAEEARRSCAEILRHILLGPLGATDTRELAETMRTLRDVNTVTER